MKSEEIKYDNEETQYDENTTMKETVKNDENIETTHQSTHKKSLGKAATGLGMGILLGSATSFIINSTKARGATPTTINDENIVDDNTSESPIWTDGNIAVATGVNDNMSFAEAFNAARTEVGPGGAFEWQGNVYGTYTAEEWALMTEEEKKEYNNHFNWSNHATAEAEIGSENATPETGGENATPETSGENATPETSGENATPETSGENAIPETDGSIHIDETNNDITSSINNTTEVEIIDSTPADVEILGVIPDEGNTGNIGSVIIDGQEVILIDVDGTDDQFEYMAADLDNDGRITADEIVDISDQNISVSQFNNYQMEDHSLYTTMEGSIDYTNDTPEDIDLV